jgi:hypothetical protein
MLHEECHEELVTLMKCNCEGYRVDDKNCLSNAEEIERRGSFVEKKVAAIIGIISWKTVQKQNETK